MENLPEDIYVSIMSKMTSASDILAFSSTCKTIRQAYTDHTKNDNAARLLFSKSTIYIDEVSKLPTIIKSLPEFLRNNIYLNCCMSDLLAYLDKCKDTSDYTAFLSVKHLAINVYDIIDAEREIDFRLFKNIVTVRLYHKIIPQNLSECTALKVIHIDAAPYSFLNRPWLMVLPKTSVTKLVICLSLNECVAERNDADDYRMGQVDYSFTSKLIYLELVNYGHIPLILTSRQIKSLRCINTLILKYIKVGHSDVDQYGRETAAFANHTVLFINWIIAKDTLIFSNINCLTLHCVNILDEDGHHSFGKTIIDFPCRNMTLRYSTIVERTRI